MSLLYLYDGNSSIDRKQANGRFTGNVTQTAISSIKKLHLQFRSLMMSGRKFNRVLIQTHGSSGNIYFGKEWINSTILLTQFMGKYDSLFEANAKLVFDGCNVAEGENGWKFLQSAGKVFLKSGGGVVIGYTNLGLGMPGFLPFIGGHTIHTNPIYDDGTVRKVYISFGGDYLYKDQK